MGSMAEQLYIISCCLADGWVPQIPNPPRNVRVPLDVEQAMESARHALSDRYHPAINHCLEVYCPCDGN